MPLEGQHSSVLGENILVEERWFGDLEVLGRSSQCKYPSMKKLSKEALKPILKEF